MATRKKKAPAKRTASRAAAKRAAAPKAPQPKKHRVFGISFASVLVDELAKGKKMPSILRVPSA